MFVMLNVNQMKQIKQKIWKKKSLACFLIVMKISLKVFITLLLLWKIVTCNFPFLILTISNLVNLQKNKKFHQTILLTN